MKSKRRDFLKSALKGTGAILLVSSAEPFKLMLFASGPPPEEGPWWGIGIDITRCIGCGHCVRACKIENDVPQEPFYFRNWVEQYTILNNGEIHIDSPNGGIDGFKQIFEDEEIFKTFFVPKMCNHCANSPCTQVCPVGAAYESPEGVSLVDETYCIGCGYCVQACPYGCRYLHPEKKVVDKCTLCYHRLKEGVDPVCMDTLFRCDIR